jgi:hypothetical protein
MQNKWGTYPWFLEHGKDKIHPDDMDNFKKETNNCKVFECVEECSQFITLKYGENQYRVKNDLFNEVPTPGFTFGQTVRLTETPGQDAIITDIMWHYVNKEPYFLVKVDGKKKSKRFFKADFSFP